MCFRSSAWVAAVWICAAAAAPAQEPLKLRPGARGKLCLGCHADVAESLKQAHVHAPVAGGGCVDCHDPHASSHGQLLGVEPQRICLTCHAEVVGDSPASAHEAARKGDCASCHRAHASQHAGLLVRPGNELCAGCHAELAARLAGARFGHAPVGDDCLTCHDPHASLVAGHLLSKTEPELCLDCHSASGAAFRERHRQYPVERGRCSSCHDPHGSNHGGLLWDNVHQPVAAGRCAQCHGEPGTPAALETRRDGLELCVACHGELVDRAFAARRIHGPLLDRVACLNCHSPHAAPVSGLLRARPERLCGECHADVIARQERSRVAHEPVAQGDCSACHDAHASDHAFLLPTADTLELCGGCHDWQRHSSHPIGPGVTDLRNPNLDLDCSSCHRSHGSPHEHLSSFEPKRELCVECHETFRR
jgi:predicted CXXCH cytochrome family protein